MFVGSYMKFILSHLIFIVCSHFFLKILFICRAKGREGEREGEKHQCLVASLTTHTGALAHNLGMCPD